MNEENRRTAGEDWWSTDIIEMHPGIIRYHGYAIEDLIGKVGFPEMIWLMLRGDLPSAAQASLLSTVLMSAIDHGPQAPSIAIARIASTCGVGINNAMASAANVLGDVHGGAGEQCVALYNAIQARCEAGEDITSATHTELAKLKRTWRALYPRIRASLPSQRPACSKIDGGSTRHCRQQHQYAFCRYCRRS